MANTYNPELHKIGKASEERAENYQYTEGYKKYRGDDGKGPDLAQVDIPSWAAQRTRHRTGEPMGVPMTPEMKAQLGGGLDFDTSGKEWDYKTAETGRKGEPMPRGATGFTPDGRPYYGEGLAGIWTKVKSIVETYQAKGTGAIAPDYESEEYKAMKLELDEAEGPWEEAKLKYWKHGALKASADVMWAVALGGLQWTEEELIERPVTTASMVLEELAADSNWKAMPSKHLDFLGGFGDLLERMSPIRATWNFLRGVEAAITKGKLPEGRVAEIWKTSYEASRMGYSIGANQEMFKEEFLQRVSMGERADLVAMDMEKPWAEFAGRAVFDIFWVVGGVLKATKSARVLNTSEKIMMKAGEEVAQFFASKGDDIPSLLKAGDHIDELVELGMKSIQETTAEMVDEAGKFGLREFTGKARQANATKEAAVFGSWIAGTTNNPDKAIGILEHMALWASPDPAEAKRGFAFLVDAMGNPEPIFSPAGKKFAVIMRELLLDESGALNAKKFADDFLELQKAGDVKAVWEFVGAQMDTSIKSLYPELSDVVKAAREAGETLDLSLGARLLYKMETSAAGKVKNAVSWFAGRAYIGMNPGVAVRGGIYDLMQSVVDTDMSILLHKPQTWADISVRWMGGMEPAGLTKGFSKAEIAGLDSILAGETGYKNVPSYLDAILGRGAKTAKDQAKAGALIDKLTLPAARLLERLEISSSQRIMGKSIDTTMKKILRQDGALKAIDEMVQLGLPAKAADDIIERIIGNYGDSEKVRKEIIGLITAGELELFSSASWLPDDIRKILEDAHVMPEFMENIKAGRAMDEVLDGLWKIKDDLFTKTEGLTKQHVQAVISSLVQPDPEDVISINKGLYEAIENGAPLQAILDEANDIAMLGRDTKNAWIKAGEMLQTSLYHALKKENPELAAQIIEMGDEFRKIGNSFAKYTVANSDTMDQVYRWTKKIRGGKGDEVATFIRGAADFFGINAIDPKNKRKAINTIWEVMKGDRQTLGFRAARQATGTEYNALIRNLSKIVPKDLLDDIIHSSGWVERAQLMERLAVQFDDAIMIGGEMRPAGEFMRSMLAAGDNKGFIRVLSAFTKYSPSGASTSIFDGDILRMLQRMNPEIGDDLSKIDPEEAFQAFQKWRVSEGGFTQQADDLIGLLGPNPNVRIPKATAPIYRIFTGMIKGQKATPDEMAQVIRFVMDNGVGDDHAKIGEIIDLAKAESAGDEVYEVIGKIAEDVHNRLLGMLDSTADDFDILDSGISNRVATPEMKALLKRLGIEVPEKYVTQAEAWVLIQAEKGGKQADKIDEVLGLVPPFDGGSMTEARNIYENRDSIIRAFNAAADGIKKNHGAFIAKPEDVSEGLFKAVNKWFDDTGQKVSEARLMAGDIAQAERDFGLHDYTQQYGFDQLLSYFFNFSYWPSRTAEKWLSTRLWENPGLISAYMNKRDLMQKIHADSPDWWKQSINMNEMFGLEMDNPLYFRMENLVQPIYFAGQSDFTDDKKRVNWWSTMADDIGKVVPGYYNPLITFALASGLKQKEEDEAAARWAGRLLPATGLIKGISALIGLNAGKGVEVDPFIRHFSGALGPYERQRVATTLAQYVKNGDYTEEEIIEAARTHSGEAWESAIRDQSQKYATGNIISSFGGINTRVRTREDLQVDQFWGSYSRLWTMSDSMTPAELRYNMEKLRETYPFMDALLLARKGGIERSEGYVWNVLARVQPGKTDDMSAVLGLPYDLISKFYEDKGDTTDWEETDRTDLFNSMVDLGTSLAIPPHATRMEWGQASMNYTNMLEAGKEIWGDEIWDQVDLAYAAMDEGINSTVSFQNFLDTHPDAEAAMDWKKEQVLNDPLLGAYYASHSTLRKYYEGEMYQKLEDEFGSDIWNKWDMYYAYLNVGDSVTARRYKAQNPELKQYSAAKKKYQEDISKNMIEYGQDLPEGISMRLQEDFEQVTAGQKKVEDYLAQPEKLAYTVPEWVEMIGQEETRIAITAYKGLILPEDIRPYYENIAESFGLSFEELLISIGTASEKR